MTKRVHIVAPASCCSFKTLDEIQNVLGGNNILPILPDDLLSKTLIHLGTSNSSLHRSKHLLKVFKDNDVPILSIRGGYGCIHIMDDLIKHPYNINVPFVGFSDITYIHLFLNIICNIPSVHGPVLSVIKEVSPDVRVNGKQSLKDVFNIIFGITKESKFKLEPLYLPTQMTSDIFGTTLGGNSTIVCSSLGTPYAPFKKDIFLMLEDNKKGKFADYQIERDLYQLLFAGILQNCTAIILGDIRSEENALTTTKLREIVSHFCKETQLKKPFFHTKCFGHGNYNVPFTLNVKAKITSDFKLKIQNPWYKSL
ncbi:MAG: LD-carboxypeptidase [Alphaproteobacteria bacterium]